MNLYIGIIVHRDWSTTLVTCGSNYACVDGETRTEAEEMKAEGQDIVLYTVKRVGLTVASDND